MTLPRWRPLPLHPLLLVCYAVLFLYAQNLAEVTLPEALGPLARGLAGVAVAMAAAGLLYRDLRRGALVASALAVTWYGFGHLATLLAPQGLSREVQLLGWGIFLGAVALLAWRLPGARVTSLTRALDVLGVVLLGLTLVTIVPHEADLMGRTVASLQRGTPAGGERDIWYLVFDRYGSNDALRAFAGVENDLPDWLAGQGFYVARDSHANYGRTALSLAATLNLEYLDEVAASLGPDSNDLEPVNRMIADDRVARFLQGRGYRFVHVGAWFGPTSRSLIADENVRRETDTDFDLVVHDTSFQPVVEDFLGREEMIAHHRLHRETALYELGELERIAGEPGPRFVFAHVLLPHDPYVFLADGSYPGAEQRERPNPERFAEQLAWTNERIRDLVTRLLDVPEERRPVIVIQADEGPYPVRYDAAKDTFDWALATPDELVTKYGILSAFYLPVGGGPDLYPTISPVNTFRLLFARLFGEDLPLLPDRSFTSKGYKRPYDFTDVSERLGLGLPPG